MFWWGLLLGLVIGVIILDQYIRWQAREERYRTGKLNPKEEAEFQEELAESKVIWEKKIAEIMEKDRAKTKLKKAKK